MRVYGLRENFIPTPREAAPRGRAPREMHDATCAECGNQCKVPFKPNGLKPVYCSDCFQKHRPATRARTGRTPRRY